MSERRDAVPNQTRTEGVARKLDLRCTCDHEFRCHATAAPHPCCEDAERTTWHCDCKAFTLPKRLASLVASLVAAEARAERLQAENAARIWHRPMWSTNVGGSISDGKCGRCGQHWPCAFVKNTAEQAFAERDEARARVTELEAAIPDIVRPIATLRHALPCSMRKAIYDGARCDCDLTAQHQAAVAARIRAALAAASPQQEPDRPGQPGKNEGDDAGLVGRGRDESSSSPVLPAAQPKPED